jgi:heme/copper-type cytochrome/quinol oxidase subunit 2
MVAVFISTKNINSHSVEVNYSISELTTGDGGDVVNYLKVIYNDSTVAGLPGLNNSGSNSVFKQIVHVDNDDLTGSFVIQNLREDTSYSITSFIQLVNNAQLIQSNQISVHTLPLIETPVISNYVAIGLDRKIDLEVNKLVDDESLTKISLVYSYNNIINMETYDILPTMFISDATSDSSVFRLRFPVAEDSFIPDDVHVEVTTFVSRIGEDSNVSNTFVVQTHPVPDKVADNDLSAVYEDSEITISWLPSYSPGYFPITGYLVSVYDITNPLSPVLVGEEVSLEESVLTHKFSGLTNGTKYSTQVKVVNENGSSDPTAVSGYPYAPSDEVVSLTVDPSDKSLTFNWTAPSVTGGFAISGYRISFNGGEAVDVSANVLSQTHNELVNGTLYSLVVKPLTVNMNDDSIVVGAEKSVSGYPYTSSDAVDSLTVVPADKSLTFNWTAPSVTGGFEISGYRLSFNDGEDVNVSADVLSQTYDELVNGTSYTLVVKPLTVNMNDDSTVVGAEKSVSGSPYDSPDDVDTLTVVPADKSLTFNWTAPSSTGGFEVSGYRLSFNGGEEVDVSANVLSQTYDELVNGTLYPLVVKPLTTNVNDGSIVVGTEKSVSGYPYAPSDQVSTLSVVPANTSLTFNWTAPSVTGGFDISGYRLSLNGGEEVDVSANVLSKDYSELVNGTLYTLVVKPLTINMNDDLIVVGAEKSVSGYPHTSSNAVNSLTFVSPDKSLTFNWTAPSSTGGFEISCYRLSFNGGADVDVSANVLSQTYDELINGTSYTFSITPISIDANTNTEVVGASQLVPSAIPFGSDNFVDCFSSFNRFDSQPGTYSNTYGPSINFLFQTLYHPYAGNLYNGTKPKSVIFTINEDNVETPYYTRNDPLVDATIYLTGSVFYVNGNFLKLGTKYIVKAQYVFNDPNKDSPFCANPNVSSDINGGFVTDEVYPVKTPSNVSGLQFVTSSVSNQLVASWNSFPVNDVSYNGGFPVVRYDVYYRVNGATSYVLHGSAVASSNSYAINSLYISNAYDVLVKTVSLDTSRTPNVEMVSSGVEVLNTMVYLPPIVPFEDVRLELDGKILSKWVYRTYSSQNRYSWNDVTNKSSFSQITKFEDYKLVFSSDGYKQDVIRPDEKMPVYDKHGWKFSNTSGGKINWYLQVPPKTSFASIKNVSFQVTLNNVYNANSLPFVTIYTKYKDDGLDRATWYRSRYTYIYDQETSSLVPGNVYNMQVTKSGSLPLTFSNMTDLNLTMDSVSTRISSGASDDDEVYLMAFGTSSSATVGRVDLVSHSVVILRGDTAMSHGFGWDDFRGSIPDSFDVKLDNGDYTNLLASSPALVSSQDAGYKTYEKEFQVGDYAKHTVSIIAHGKTPSSNSIISSAEFVSAEVNKYDTASSVSNIARVMEDKKATVSWNSPINMNGGTIVPSTYKVSYGTSSSTTTISSVVVNSQTKYSAVISGLTNGTTYTFAVDGSSNVIKVWMSKYGVLSTTSDNISIASTSIDGIPHGIASIPTTVTCTEEDTKLTVKFKNSTTGNGLPITKYILKEGTTVIQTFDYVSGTSVIYSHEITGLTNGTSKTYTITPYTNYDDKDIAGVVATISGTPSGNPIINSVTIENDIGNGRRRIITSVNPNGTPLITGIYIVDPVNAVTNDNLFKTFIYNSTSFNGTNTGLITLNIATLWESNELRSNIDNAIVILNNKNGFDVRDANNSFVFPNISV